jgi:hypothetical protein
MLTKGSVEIGLETRFGPDWPGVRCGARTKAGGECQRPAVKRTGRCTRHGGKSTGPRTQDGKDKIAALHTTHGRTAKAERAKAKRRAEVGRQVMREVAEVEQWAVDHGHLAKDWRDQFK